MNSETAVQIAKEIHLIIKNSVLSGINGFHYHHLFQLLSDLKDIEQTKARIRNYTNMIFNENYKSDQVEILKDICK